MIDLTLTQALNKLKSREISATELTRAHLARIEQLNPELNAYITVTAERALTDAAAADARYAANNALPLDGIPIGMKDLFATRGIRSTGASKMLENFIPEYESTVSQNLINAGTVLLGKTNMDEFAMSGTGRTSFFGPSVNPYSRDIKLMPGGSSSGSVAAVAGGLCMAATGSDTGDSIRFPSSLTGLVGMKPTYGLCSRFGCFAYASSLDHPGSIARTVDDAAALLGAMAGCDARDSTSYPMADSVAEKLRAGIHAADMHGLRIGVIRQVMDAPGIADDMRAMFDKYIRDLTAAGAEIIDLDVPHIMMTGTLYGIISRAEAASNLARYDGMKYGLRVDGNDLVETYMKTRAAGFGENVKFRMLTGAITQTKDFYDPCFVQAAKVRRLLANEFDAAMEKCDVILTPSAPSAAIALDADLSADAARVSNAMLVPMNMLGMPGCSVPAGRNAAGLPMGLHVAGAFGDDVRVLSVAKYIEGMANLDNRPTIVMGK